MRMWLWIGLLVVAAACAPTGTDTDEPTNVPTTAATTTTTAAASDDTCRSGDLGFSESGLAAAVGEDEGDATTVTQVRWDPSPTCERVTFVLASDSGAPAGTLGPTAVLVDATTGIVRIELPAEISATATADMLPEGDLVERIIVVRTDQGAMFADLHPPVGQSVAARAFVTESPATLVVDIIPGPEANMPPGAAGSERAIVVAPLAGPAAYPFTIEGYAAPGLTSITVHFSADASVVTDRILSLPGWPDTWQQVTITIDDGPAGTVDLFVGSVDEGDAPESGASVRLDLP